MKILNLLAAMLVVTGIVTSTEIMEAKDIKFPVPAMTGGMPANEAFAKRESIRAFDTTRSVEDSVLGQLLWMSVGVNRPDVKALKMGAPANRSNPTALNWQEVRAYLFGKDGVWEYMPETHSLKFVKDGDHRSLLAGTTGFTQEFVMDAPYAVVFVADMEKLPEDDHVMSMALVDIGIACENLNIACASMGVATVPRATMDTEGISRLLSLSARQIPVMNNPIGYAR